MVSMLALESEDELRESGIAGGVADGGRVAPWPRTLASGSCVGLVVRGISGPCTWAPSERALST